MKVSIDTEIEEIAELRHAIAIIEDAIKRREDGEREIPEEEPVQEEPAPQPEPQQEPVKEEPPSIDLSKLATSDYGQTVENRTLDKETPKEEPAPQPEPQQDNKEVVKNIIQSLKDKAQGNPIQMQDIINLAKEKSVEEEETRKLVNELQSSNSI